MITVLRSTWPLLLGIMLLLVGNGMQGTLLGIRGGIEEMSTDRLAVVMSAYFGGFLLGSLIAPGMIQRVGHVRVFAALGSLISAVLIMYAALPNWIMWSLLRLLIGFCFSGVYITAESWLNASTGNEKRGQAMSLYMIVQMIGIVSAQGLFLVADPAGYETFVIASVVVSVSFAPILLSISPTPAFDTTKPMTLKNLMKASPLGCVGMFLLGGVFSAQFGMSAVYAASAGLTLTQISIFVATFYVGALLLQYPLGWFSDRMDRRVLILFGAASGGGAALFAMLMGGNFLFLLAAAFVIGGMTNPLYSLLIAHTNDYLDYDDMPAASGGLVFINGLGAVAGPVITGWLMGDGVFGAPGFFLFMAVLLLALGIYATYRMTQRAAIPTEETGTISPMSPTASPVAVEFAQEYAIETEIEEQEAASEAAAEAR